MIIQTGQRTDIPAFYSDWFANRLREGYVLVRNPYNPQAVTPPAQCARQAAAVLPPVINVLQSFLSLPPHLLRYMMFAAV